MTYKWEAMVEDLTVERDRLLKDYQNLKIAAQATIDEVSWFVSRKKNLAGYVDGDEGDIWADVLNGDLDLLRDALNTREE